MSDTVLLPEKAIAERFSLGLSWLRAARCRGNGPRFVKLGRKVLYDVAEVEKFVAERVVSSTSEVARNG